ncbi:MAG TPA: APC family permease [Candidatus Babeliales bacterium]|nr:APC family permease [Candidatus Babeliales bacterium]
MATKKGSLKTSSPRKTNTSSTTKTSATKNSRSTASPKPVGTKKNSPSTKQTSTQLSTASKSKTLTAAQLRAAANQAPRKTAATDQQPKIGLATATIVGMNAMIGAGVFTIPVALAATAGPAGMLTIISVAIGVWFMASAMARLAAAFPAAGSFYVYAKQWGGQSMGVLASVTYLIGLMIGMGLLTRIAALNLQFYFPQFSVTELGLMTLLILTVIATMGVRVSSLWQQIMIVLTIAPLVVIAGLCVTKLNLSYLTPFVPFGWGNVFQASQIVVFAFFGFESAASLFTVVEKPAQNVPRALAYAVLLVALIYTLFVGTVMLAIPASLLQNTTAQLPNILLQLFPTATWLIDFVRVSMIISIVGTIHAMTWGSSNLLVDLIRQLESRWARQLTKFKQFNAQSLIYLIGLAIATTFLTLTNINLFFSLTALFIVFAYGSSMIALLKLKTASSWSRRLATYLGLLTAALIFYFAATSLLAELGQLF